MPDPSVPEASITETIAYLQWKAYQSAGISPADLSSHFAGLRLQAQEFQIHNPSYLITPQELAAADPDLDFVELDLAKRFDVTTPTPFQNPWSYAILRDYWEYQRRKLYRDGTLELILATAPTCDYNAYAVTSDDQFGILVEDGLIYLARLVCSELAPLLYTRVEGGYLPRAAKEVRTEVETNPSAETIARAVHRFVHQRSVLPPPPVVDRHADFQIRHVLFAGFVAFVLEHELYHLRKSRMHDDDEEFQRAFGPVWRLFDSRLRNHLPNIPSRERLEELLRRHREEVWADAVGVSRVMLLGKIENTVSASLCGSLIFHYLAESIRTATLLIDQADLVESERDASEETLAAQALYLGESHPYPKSRLASVYAILKRSAPHYQGYLDPEMARLNEVFSAVSEWLKTIANPDSGAAVSLGEQN